MRDALFDLCRRFADAHVDSSGVAVTPVPGITLVRALHPGDLQAAIARPLVAMLLQGRKSVTTGLASFDYGPGEAMVIAADVPTTSQITEASQRFPYYALVLELDLAILRELQEAGPAGPDEAPRVGIEPMNADVTDAAYRLASNIKKTQKRANALQNITIPMYENLVYTISNALEEKEREEFTRLKVIKQMKEKKEKK